MRHYHSKLPGILVASCTWLVSNANAYEITTCNGKPWGGIHQNRAFPIDRCHTAAGSSEEAVISHGMKAWNTISGVADRFLTPVDGPNNCTSAPAWGTWEVAIVPSNYPWLDGNAGIAIVDQPAVCNSLNGEAGGATVLVNEAYPLSQLDELDISVGARETMIHELGHVLGLDHEEDVLSVMCGEGYTCGKVGLRGVTGGLGNRAESQLPDDTAFMVDYHSSSGSGRADAVLSPWEPAGGAGSRHHISSTGGEAVVTACPGSIATVSFSFGNIGKADITSGNPAQVIVVLSENNYIHLDDHWVATALATATGGFSDDASLNFQVPFLPAATYWVGLLIDAGDSIPEDDEYNNAIRSGLRVKIPTGC